MRATRGIVALLITGAIAGCGGRTSREAFVSEANMACSERARAEEDADKGARARSPDDVLAASTRAYERELGRLQSLEPPDEDRVRYDEMLRNKEQALAAWREFVRHAKDGDAGAGEPALVRTRAGLVRAARIAGELGLDDCDRALS
jgi:hypothetical protein